LKTIIQIAEIHFHEQEKASVFIESNCSGDAEKLAEIMFLMFYAVRQMSNLDVNEMSDSLAGGLLKNLGAYIEDFASGKQTGGLQLVPYPGYAGRKRFLAKLEVDETKVFFDLKAEGFDVLAQGVGYYVPTSVLALIRHFAMRRKGDRNYLGKLCAGAGMCGDMHLHRHITLANHAELVLPLVPFVCEGYMDSVL
jgi:hypothetical protein